MDGEKLSTKEMAGKAVIVTGGGGAFGAAIGHEFAGKGASVVVADLDGAAAKRVADEISRKAGVPTLAVACDVRHEADVQTMVQTAVAAYSRVDVLVNNAGIFPMGPLLETTVEKWDDIMAVNMRGVFLCSKHVIPTMSAQGSGCIVNIASNVGKTALPNLIPYSTSKAAVIAMTVGLAKEFGSSGIRVNAVCPSAVATPGWAESKKVLSSMMGLPEEQVIDALVQGQTIKRMLTPQEVAKVVAWLASDDTSLVTGQAISIDGGSSFPTY
jgi:NAD(P)-dependent dehydrogenase (short-subunit alcohol dehydrogenase family)